MKRLIDYYLLKWKTSPLRQPLLLRGARQVGKTYAVRELGKTFDSFVELNFELQPTLQEIFQDNLNPETILNKLFVITHQKIVPGKTLLFFDEIQSTPNAIISLRYFYEMMPELHVIAAGSLLDFAIQSVGMPVGRVTSYTMYPVSFMEFLSAMNAHGVIDEILSHDIKRAIKDVFHDTFFSLLAQYLTIGGMPQTVAFWQTTQDLSLVSEIPQRIIRSYKQDFEKYAATHQIKYLNVLLNHIPQQLGGKFKYSDVEGDYRKRELAPCLDLLVTANVVHKVIRTGAQGIPLGAQADLHAYKIIFIDVALTQFMLGLKVGNWIINPLEEFVNKGELVEAFVGQELVAYNHPLHDTQLYYWQRETRGGEAEIDYVIQQEANIIPIEVKSGKGTAMKSMKSFLESHPASPYGIRFSTHNYSIHENIYSYPLYAVAKIFADADSDIKAAIRALL